MSTRLGGRREGDISVGFSDELMEILGGRESVC